jgi:hypothetical protein
MSPTILRQGPYRFDFNSREENRIHVHVEASDGWAKFWLEPFGALADLLGLKKYEIREIQQFVEKNEELFTNARHKHCAV